MFNKGVAMKLLVTSDFHGSLEASHRAASKAQIVEADIVVVCGDVTHFGSVKDAQKILAPLITLKIPILYVPGNCDPPQLAEAQISGAVCLHGICQIQGNASFLGLGGAPASQFYSLFEMTEKAIMETLSQGVKFCLQNKWFVVVSHSAPKDTRVDLAFSNIHAGSVSLRRFIEEKKPNIVFCGHIHEARGIDHIGETLIVNPGPVRHNNCAIVNFNEKIEVKLDSL